MRYFLKLDRYKPVKKYAWWVCGICFVVGLVLGMALAHVLIKGGL